MSQRFDFVETPLKGLFRVDRKSIVDDRGFFNRFFCTEEFKKIGFNKTIEQMNHTLTQQKGTIRGVHFQYPPYSETKVVTCIQGEVLDIAVDIREDSPTFLQYHAELLSAKNQSSLFIPDGFAHGFQTLTDNCQLFYLHSTSYEASAEAALNPFDPMLKISWPLEMTNISERDKSHPLLNSQFEGVNIS